MRKPAPNASPGLPGAAGAGQPDGRRHTPLLQQAVVVFVLLLMGGLGAALLLAAAVMAGYE
jgi:hypothetical protein